jgi:uncharacterized protein (TIGR03067 family)
LQLTSPLQPCLHGDARLLPNQNPKAAASQAPAPAKSAPTAFEGSWHGHDVTPGHESPASITFSGQTLEFHGGDADDWAKGTFTLHEDATPKQFVGVVTDCAAPENIGKKACAIYKIENGTLTLTGSPLGSSDFPPAFDAPECRQLVFKHD